MNNLAIEAKKQQETYEPKNDPGEGLVSKKYTESEENHHYKDALNYGYNPPHGSQLFPPIS
jgi:hypothetical protein